MTIQTKLWLKEAFANVLENMDATETTYSKYFSKDYKQYVDGQFLDYDGFVEHMKALKATMKSIKVEFLHLIVEGDEANSVHLVHGIKKDGSKIEVKVNAYLKIQNQKFILCDELTHLVKGQESDRDLGSRR